MGDQTKPKLGKTYICWTLPADKEKAAERFEERFGFPPLEIIQTQRLLWVGPTDGRPPANVEPVSAEITLESVGSVQAQMALQISETLSQSLAELQDISTEITQ